MYNQPYFIPGYFNYPSQFMMRGALNGAMRNTINGARIAGQSAGRGLGLFSRLSNSMRAIKGVNWGNLITNTSKTLNVVNQAIPLVRQVGPMVNNMRSMLKIASIFKDETDLKPISKQKQNTYKENSFINNNNYPNNTNMTNNQNNTNMTNNQNNTNMTNNQNNYSNYYDNSPTFFINT